MKGFIKYTQEVKDPPSADTTRRAKATCGVLNLNVKKKVIGLIKIHETAFINEYVARVKYRK